MNKGTLRVRNINGQLFLQFPNQWKQLGLKDGDTLPASIHNNQLTIDFRKIIGRKINDSFKGIPLSEADMKKTFGKDGW